MVYGLNGIGLAIIYMDQDTQDKDTIPNRFINFSVVVA